MSMVRNLGAIIILSVTASTQASAQQAMSEPAYCAFFYPNANCQDKGPGNPYTDPNYRRYGAASQWSNASAQVPAKRTHRPPLH